MAVYTYAETFNLWEAHMQFNSYEDFKAALESTPITELASASTKDSNYGIINIALFRNSKGNIDATITVCGRTVDLGKGVQCLLDKNPAILESMVRDAMANELAEQLFGKPITGSRDADHTDLPHMADVGDLLKSKNPEKCTGCPAKNLCDKVTSDEGKVR